MVAQPEGRSRLIKVCLASLIHSSGTFSSHQRLMVAAGSCWLKKKSWKNPMAPVHHYQQWPSNGQLANSAAPEKIHLNMESDSKQILFQCFSFYKMISARCHWRGYSIRGRFLSRTCLKCSDVFVPCFKDRANGAYFISAKKSTSQTGTAV